MNGYPKWFDNHPNAWRPPGFGPHPGPGPWGPGPHPGWGPPPPPPPGWWWGNPGWGYAWGWFGAGFFTGVIGDEILDPFPYDYGSNIVYGGDTVYVNDVPYVGADEYYQQAQEIANAGTGDTVGGADAVSVLTGTEKTEPAETQDDWLSMGTFAIVGDNDQKDSNRILQIASNKQGLIRGNLIDRDTDQAVELYGSVDPKTQRVAFKTRGNDVVVAECGLWNLTQEKVPMLVHVNRDKTEERTLIRLKNDKAEEKTAPSEK